MFVNCSITKSSLMFGFVEVSGKIPFLSETCRSLSELLVSTELITCSDALTLGFLSTSPVTGPFEEGKRTRDAGSTA